VTPLYPQKLALTSPTGGGRSVGIVRVRTKATEFVLFVVCVCFVCVRACKSNTTMFIIPFSGNHFRSFRPSSGHGQT